MALHRLSILGPVLPLETVPNFSEGRDSATIEAIGTALAAPGVLVLDVHSDADHNRSVFTACGPADGLEEGLAAAVATAVERIDMRRHDGVHPCIGAADVVPIVPLEDRRRAEAHALVERLAPRLAALGLPVFLYAESGHGRRPHDLRRGGLEGLGERLAERELEADAGEGLHPSAGAVILGVRRPLVAFNVDLATDRLDVAREAAAAVRERSGGFPGLRALGVPLPGRGRVQVSMNIEEPDLAPLATVMRRIREVAQTHGTEVERCELVGLMPAGMATGILRDALPAPGLHAGSLLEVAIARAAAGERVASRP
jgi:glutamate formiminotransferase